MRSCLLVAALAALPTSSVAGCAYPKQVAMVEVPHAVVPPHPVAPPPPSTCADDDEKAEAGAAAVELAADLAEVVLTAVLR